MNQAERRMFLIEELLKEDPRYQDMGVPMHERDQKDLLRALMNVRAPKPVTEEFLEVQDAYLAQERDSRGVTDGDALAPVRPGSPLVLWQGDITTLRVDAIVNAANCALRGCFVPLHGCIDNMIHTRSGVQLRLTCDEIMNRQGYDEPTGRAKITPAYNLPCRYVLHTVGPIIRGRVSEKDRALLRSCYQSCLALAAENGCESVAFCCVSTGEFHFPNREAAEIAVETVNAYLSGDARIKRVIFNVFKDLDLEIYRELLEA